MLKKEARPQPQGRAPAGALLSARMPSPAFDPRPKQFSKTAPAATAEPPVDQKTLDAIARAVEKFDADATAGFDHLRRKMEKRVLRVLGEAGVEDPGAMAKKIWAATSVHTAKTIETFTCKKGSPEEAERRKMQDDATAVLVKAAWDINVARFGHEGAVVVERLGAVACIRQAAAQDIRRVLSSAAAYDSDRKAPSGAEFHWLDQITNDDEHALNVGVRFPGVETETYDEPPPTARRRTATASVPTWNAGQVETETYDEPPQRTRKAPQRVQTAEDMMMSIEMGDAALREVYSSDQFRKPAQWSILEFLATNPCARKMFNISALLDKLNSARGGGKEDTFTTEEGGVRPGFLNRAAQFTKGAVEEAEKRGAYKVTAAATTKRAIVVGRIFNFLTTWMQMNTYASLKSDAEVQIQLRETVKKARDHVGSALEDLDDADQLSGAWQAMTHITDPANPENVLPVMNPSEPLARSVYAVCGPKEGLDRVLRIASQQPSSVQLESGVGNVAAYVDSLISPSGNVLLRDGEPLTTASAASSLTETEAAAALETLVARVNQLPIGSSPAYMMSSIVARKTTRSIFKAKENLVQLDSDLENLNKNIANLQSDELVGWIDLANNYGLQYASVLVPDLMNFYMTGRLAASVVNWGYTALTGSRLGEGVDVWNKSQSNFLVEGVARLTGYDASSITLAMSGMSLTGILASAAFQKHESLIDFVVPHWLRKLFATIPVVIGKILQRISQAYQLIKIEHVLGALEPTGLVRPAAYLAWWTLDTAADILIAALGFNVPEARKGLGNVMKKLALEAKAEAFILSLQSASPVVFTAVRISYGAASLLNIGLQALGFISAGLVQYILAMSLGGWIVAGLAAVMVSSPFLIPHELLVGTSLESASKFFLLFRRAISYALVDPPCNAFYYNRSPKTRAAIEKIGGYLGFMGNLICMRPEIGVFGLTFASIVSRHGLSFALNRALLKNTTASLPEVAKRVAQEEERFRRESAVRSLVPVSDDPTNPQQHMLHRNMFELLMRYGSTICALGEGAVTGPPAYRALEETFFSQL